MSAIAAGQHGADTVGGFAEQLGDNLFSVVQGDLDEWVSTLLAAETWTISNSWPGKTKLFKMPEHSI